MIPGNYNDNFSNNKLKPNKKERIVNPINAFKSSDLINRTISQLFTILYAEDKLEVTSYSKPKPSCITNLFNS